MKSTCAHNRRLVGERVNELRKAQGLSLRKLAHMVSMDYAYISKLENGRENPTLDVLSKLADGLDVELSELFVHCGEKDYAFIEMK